MDRERLHDWVEEKIEAGYSEDQVSKILEKHGYSDEVIKEVEEEQEQEISAENEFQNNISETGNEETGFSPGIEVGRHLNFKLLLLPLVLAVLVAGGYTLYSNGGMEIVSSMQQPSQNETKQTTSANNTVEVVLEGNAPDPSRANIGQDEKLSFVNSFNQKVTLESDSLEQNIEIEAGGSKIVDFNSISYYTVKVPGKENDLQGSVYVE